MQINYPSGRTDDLRNLTKDEVVAETERAIEQGAERITITDNRHDRRRQDAKARKRRNGTTKARKKSRK